MPGKVISMLLTLAMLVSVVSGFAATSALGAEAKMVIPLLVDDFESYTSYDDAAGAGWACSGELAAGRFEKDRTKYIKVRTGNGNKVYKTFAKQVKIRYSGNLTDSDTSIANPGKNAKIIAEYDFNSMGFDTDTITNVAWYGLTNENYMAAAAVSTKPAVSGGGYVYAKNTVNITDTKIIVPFDAQYPVWQSVRFEITLTDANGNFLPDGPSVLAFHKVDGEWVDRTAAWAAADSKGTLDKVEVLDRFIVTSNASSRDQAVDNINIYLENEGAAVATEVLVVKTPAPEVSWTGMVTTPGKSAAVPETKAVGSITKEQAAKDAKGRFMTPSGAGIKDGSSWENAIDGSAPDALQKGFDALENDGTLYVLGGEYKDTTAVLSKSGESVTAPKKIVGIDDGANRAKFTGGFDPNSNDGANIDFVTFEANVKNISIENLAVNNYRNCFYTKGANEGLRFYNISLAYFGDGFYLDGGSSAAGVKVNKDIIVDGCDGYWFRKRFVRFRNGNNGAIVSNCKADAGGKDAWFTGNWPVGVGIEDNGFGAWEENITVVDSVFENSYQEPEDLTKYWNGDGVSAERTTRNVTFIRVKCFGATDGGWDLKTVNPVLIDCIAMGNKRGFRFWSEECATLINCLGAYAKEIGGGSSVGLWTNANVEAYNCTFFNNQTSQVEVAEGTGRMALFNCIVGYYGIKSQVYSIGGAIEAVEPQIKVNVVEFDNKDPQFKNMSDAKFYGDNDNWNSALFSNGEAGYFYDPNKTTSAFKATSDYGSIVDIFGSYDWARESIDFMTEKKFMPALAHTAFGTQYRATRSDFVAMLVRTLGLKADKAATFTDVKKTNEFYAEIGVAEAVGLVKGDGTGLFRPYDNMTREEMMVMLSRALKLAGKLTEDYAAPVSGLDRFTDAAGISEWAKQEIANMTEKGIIKGGTDGGINPKGNTTRAEAAVIGKRIYDMK